MIVLLALACSSKHTDAPVAAAPAPVAVESNVPAGALPGATPLERGTYLTSAVVDCVHCHTKRDLNDFRNAHGPEWAGGEVFDAAWKIPGTVITPNLTSDVETGIGAWTDDEVKRAIREGVNRQGERLFPLMPSHYFQAMSDEDLAGIVAVLRSLPPATKPTTQQTVLQMPREALPKLRPSRLPFLRRRPTPSLAGSTWSGSPTAGRATAPRRAVRKSRSASSRVACTSPRRSVRFRPPISRPIP